MKLRFDRDELNKAVQIVNNAAGRGTLPILANILIQADDRIRMVATDLEIGIKIVVEGEVVEPGSITIPAKKLSDIIKELPSETVELATMASDRVEIKCAKGKFRLPGLSADEFPNLPDIGDEYFTFDSTALCSMLQKTAFCISTEETRVFLSGIYFVIDGNDARMVSTDGRRLAVIDQAIEGSHDIGVIIPIKAVQNIIRTFADSETVDIALLDNQVVLASGAITLISRLIEGEYPDYNAVLSPILTNEIAMTVNTQNFLAALRRVSLLANPTTTAIKIVSKEGAINIFGDSVELGSAQEEMSATIEGGNVDIAMNASFVMDVLRHIETDEAIFRFRDAMSPVLVMPTNDDDYKCVIMPMRL